MNKEEVYKLLETHYRVNFDTCVKRYSRFLQSHHRAEDIVQEAYTRAFTYWKSAPSDGSIHKWLGTILSNCMKDNQRSESMSGMSDSTTLEELPVDCNAFPRLVYQEIVAAIDSEPDNIRIILRLSLLDQYQSKEIASVVPESADAVRKIVQRFRDKIKEVFRNGR